MVFATVEQGPIATVTRRGARFGEQKGDVWHLGGGDIANRYQLTMAGGGGHGYSVPWPSGKVDGTTLRYHVWRDADDVMRLTLYNSNTPEAAPWWEAQAKLPEELRDVPLKHVTVFTGKEAEGFDPEEQNLRTSDKMDGVIRQIRGQILDAGEEPAYNQPLDDVAIPDPEGWSPEPTMLREDTLKELRQKFNSPAFEHYRTVLLRNADKHPDPKDKALDDEMVVGLVWGYLLTEDRSYLDRAMARIDTITSATDYLPSEKDKWPGNRRQYLDIRQFNSHKMAALAMAFDLLGEEMGAQRRARVRYALDRSLDYYMEQVRRNDWWFAGNPSNTIGVGNGSMGLIALALRDEFSEKAEKALDMAVHEIDETFTAIRPDGSCVEGNMYWNYGMAYPMMLGWTLRQADGDDRGLLTSERLKNAKQYLGLNLGGNNENIPFNDTMPWLQSWLVTAHAGSEFDQPLMRWFADHMAEELATTERKWGEQDRGLFALDAFLFRDEQPAPEEFPGVPDILTLEGVQEGVMRSDGSRYKPGLVTGVKGMGEISTHHTNDDQGSFVLYANGEMLLFDPGYMEPAANDHSLAVIGDAVKGKGNKGMGILSGTAVAPVEDVWSEGMLRSMAVDATQAHAKGQGTHSKDIERVRRVFIQIGEEALVLLDDIQVKCDNVPVTSFYQAMWPAEVNGSNATVTAEDTQLAIQTFGPEVEMSVEPRKLTRWVYEDRDMQWHAIAGKYTLDPKRPLVTVLVPSKKDGGESGQPDVSYADGRVEVTLPSGEEVIFERDDAGPWRAAR